MEGLIDEAVLLRLVKLIGAIPGPVYGRNGKQSLRQRLNGYNQAANHRPWAVLVDLDLDADCAPPFRTSWLPAPSRYMCFRVAVREVESWLIADQQHIARFLGVAVSRIPVMPETLDHPKETMVDLARQSRKREIREDMVPRPGSGRAVGPAYTSRLIEFASDQVNGWRPDIAASNSESLRRCLACLRKFIT